jgi:hypothetical protein
MAETTTTSGGVSTLSFIVGGLVVAVAIGAFAYYNGYLGSFGGQTTTEQTTTAPSPDGATTTTTTIKTTP